MPGIGSVPRPAAAVSGSAFSVSSAVVKLPELMAAPMLMPNCLSSERCTSATVTLSITCSSPSTVSRLMTSLVSLPQAAAWFWVWLSYWRRSGCLSSSVLLV